MIKKIINIIAVAQAVAFSSVPVQKAAEPTTGYKIYLGQYVSEILIGDIMHDYIGKGGGLFELGHFGYLNTSQDIRIAMHINSNGTVEDAFLQFDNKNADDLIDWEKSNLSYDPSYNWRYPLKKTNFCLYFKRPLETLYLYGWTENYLTYTSPAREFAAGYDGFIPSFYYASISGNKTYFESITSLSSLPTGKAWQSGDVSGYGIKINDFIIQNYYVSADILESEKEYVVNLWAYAKSNDGQKSVDLIIQPRLGYVNLQSNINEAKTYYFPQPISTLTTTQGYYNIIRSSGAYGLTESIKNYEEGYKDGQGNPTFKSFIVSAFEACSAFFSLPVLGEHITIGALIGAFVGLGALFLIIRLFR